MNLHQLKDLFIKESEDIEKDLIEIRRHLHKYPELSFQEHETSHFVEERLKEIGISYVRVGETGIKAIIKGEETENYNNRTIGLRADMDALPIKEETGLSFASENYGVMHACGHDGHTAILLGAAQLLYKNKKSFGGTVVCIFQPGEEADGAATEMIQLGVLENPKVDRMVALHMWPYIPLGSIGVRSDSMTASCDDFTITIRGKSGHSARPHEGVDAINIAMRFMQAIEHLVIKMNNPLDPSVVHIGKIEGGTARNIIAEKVTLEGTSRALTVENRKKIRKEIERLAKQVANTFNATADVHYTDGNAPVINDAYVTSIVDQAAVELWGMDKVVKLQQPSMGADDFGEFSLEVPSSYFRLGVKKTDETAYSLHHPKFNFDDTVLSTGAATFAYIAVKATESLEG